MRKIGTLLLAAALCFGVVAPAGAQSRLSLIRDAEIESNIRALLTPILRAAGLNAQSVRIYLIDDPGINASVSGGQAIYLNTGLILRAKNVGELLGVLAHESGHIAGGHLVRGNEEMERQRRIALIGTLLGAAAGAAAGSGGAAIAGIGGAATYGQRSFLAFTRSMESQADQAGLRFLDRAGISAEGTLSFLEMLSDQQLLGDNPQYEYLRTHPLTEDRIDAVRAHVESSPLRGASMPPGFDELFARTQAKLFGFTQPQQVARVFPETDRSMAATYARAIASYRRGDLGSALPQVDALIAAEPNNPYFHELKGQILLEYGRLAEARPSYERALALLPDEPLLLIPLAQTKIEGGSEAELRSAIADLERASRDRGRTPGIVWRLLATAYGRTGDMGMAALALAEEGLTRGDPLTAGQQADRAMQLLPRGSPGWLRAQDLQREAERSQG